MFSELLPQTPAEPAQQQLPPSPAASVQAQAAVDISSISATILGDPNALLCMGGPCWCNPVHASTPSYFSTSSMQGISRAYLSHPEGCIIMSSVGSFKQVVQH